MLGPNFIERDAMTRRMQYRGDALVDWASYGPDAKAIAEAFVRGVNAWVALARERPPEEFVLAGWKPEPWSADDLLNRTDAFTASGDALDEVFRARLVATVGLARARLLLPGDRALDTPAPGRRSGGRPGARRRRDPPRRHAAVLPGIAAPVTEGTVRLPASAPGASAGKQPDARLRRATLRESVAAVFRAPERAGLERDRRDGAVASGRRRRAQRARSRWTPASLDADTQDVYVEKLNPANPRQVEERAAGWTSTSAPISSACAGARRRSTSRTETTRHGVIVASDLERHLAFAIRWSGSEPGAAAELAAPALDHAASYAQFRSALTHWKMPARRLAYVDRR